MLVLCFGHVQVRKDNSVYNISLPDYSVASSKCALPNRPVISCYPNVPCYKAQAFLVCLVDFHLEANLGEEG